MDFHLVIDNLIGNIGKYIFKDNFYIAVIFLRRITVEIKNVPSAVIKRLPRYYRFLEELKKNGTGRISSRELSGRMGITASQIRQDLNFFGGFGQQGYGYNVEYLYGEIGKILGVNTPTPIIIIGAGNLGQALAKYPSFKKRGFAVKAMFDIARALVGTYVSDIPVYHIDMLEDFMEKNDISIAVLTLTNTAASEVAKRLCSCGIKGIMNFSHIDLGISDNVAVENVHMSDSLMTLSYKITNSVI